MFDKLVTESRARERVHQLRVRSRLREKRPVLHAFIWRSSRRRARLRRTTPASPASRPGVTRRRRRFRRRATLDHEAVLIEWTDSNISNSTFEGTARELMRVQLNSRIHPMGDLIFNPAARRGDPDWRVLYVACGDGGSGDQRTEHPPQPAAARHGRRKNPADHPGPRRTHQREHGEREWALPHSSRQSVRVDRRGPEGNMGVRVAQPAPSELGRGPRQPREPSSHRHRDRLSHVGDRGLHSQGSQLRISTS